jgi:hypothetical protein
MELQVGESFLNFYESSFSDLFGAFWGGGGGVQSQEKGGRGGVHVGGHQAMNRYGKKNKQSKKKIHLSETELTAIPK